VTSGEQRTTLDGYEQIRDLRFVGIADHMADAGKGGEIFRGALRVASGDNDFGARIGGVDFADGVACLGVGGSGDGAGVEDNHVGGMRLDRSGAALVE